MDTVKFKISSRATILLGRESVSKVDGAIIELVKNTYDADAELCFLCFDIEHDCIYLFDNGVGMTRETIENNWMMIGTDNKKENYKSDKKRIRSGEKGIGRFALDRLGSICEMYTKSNNSEKVILWKTDWGNFEQAGKTIDQIEAEIDLLDDKFEGIIPRSIYENIKRLEEIKASNKNGFKINLETGTLFKISNLRDAWSEKDIVNVINSMGFLIPPSEQEDEEYIICVQKTLSGEYIEVANEISEEYDYRIEAEFKNNKFYIKLYRNEFDLNKIPIDVFDMERLQKEPYRYEDFEKEKIQLEYTIAELMKTTDKRVIDAVKKIGEFNFKYTFMKFALTDDSQETFFYKEISKKRKLWLNQYSGIKIYRDHFLVRPYGIIDSDSYDWLGLDARRANNPASISHPSGNWHVRNAQGQGTIYISRVSNESILDKSSREGIIENEYFKKLKDVIKNIIQIFESDRAYIGRTMKVFSDITNEKDKTKRASKNISRKVLSTQEKKSKNRAQVDKQVKTLAKAVKYYEEEREELITEVKLLRSLATNGLITTSIVHDLKGINAQLVNRVKTIQTAIELKNSALITRNLDDLKKNDMFLKSWITVITNQTKKDKRTRKKHDFYSVVHEIIDILSPILNQKKINVDIQDDGKTIEKRIFISDFESILYNLIINSIESFEKSKIDQRLIQIHMETNGELVIHYKDNGKGLDSSFKDPYEIFNYGTTSKFDIDGEPLGTGLGMYIVSSTTREYNGKLNILKSNAGFGLDLHFPI